MTKVAVCGLRYSALRRPSTFGLKMKLPNLRQVANPPKLGATLATRWLWAISGPGVIIRPTVAGGRPATLPWCRTGHTYFCGSPAPIPARGSSKFSTLRQYPSSWDIAPTTHGYGTCHWVDWCPFSRRETFSISSITGTVCRPGD